MTIAEGICQFVEKSGEKYRIYENYTGSRMPGQKCLGIVVRQGYSYMDMLIELTQYFDENNIEDTDLSLEGVSIDELGADAIVYFPAISDETVFDNSY